MKKKIEQAITLIDQELAGTPDPRLKNILVVQKESIRKKLGAMKNAIDTGKVPSKDNRNMGIARAISDSWPFDVPLGEKLANAERAFMDID